MNVYVWGLFLYGSYVRKGGGGVSVWLLCKEGGGVFLFGFIKKNVCIFTAVAEFVFKLQHI